MAAMSSAEKPGERLLRRHEGRQDCVTFIGMVQTQGMSNFVGGDIHQIKGLAAKAVANFPGVRNIELNVACDPSRD